MSPQDHLEYFRKRAKIERAMAKEAGDTIAGQVHAALAEQYVAAIAKEQKPKLRIVAS